MNVIRQSDSKGASLLVNDDGELLVSGAGGGGGGGDASAANQVTGNALLTDIEAAVDGVEALLTTIDADTGAIASGISTLVTQTDGIEASVDGLETNTATANTELQKLTAAIGDEYETVAASQTTQTLGATGATGDYIAMLICVVSTAATSQVQIKDGSDSAIVVLPNSVAGGIGTYTIPIGLKSRTGAWQITTAAGVSVLATGNFT